MGERGEGKGEIWIVMEVGRGVREVCMMRLVEEEEWHRGTQ